MEGSQCLPTTTSESAERGCMVMRGVLWRHRKTQAVIVRCGQPQVGPGQRNRSKEDEQLLNACLPSLSKGKVLDTRPQEVVTAHMSKGVTS